MAANAGYGNLQESEMVIVLGYYKRKPGITHEQFCNHWLNVHGPLIKEIPNIDKYVLRYVQHHLTPDSHYPAPEGMDFDGFSEAWFPSLEARSELFSLPFYLKECIADERLFLDMDATRWVVTDDQEVIMAGPGGK